MSRRRFTLVLGLVAALACRPSSNVPTVAIYNLLSYPILDESSLCHTELGGLP